MEDVNAIPQIDFEKALVTWGPKKPTLAELTHQYVAWVMSKARFKTEAARILGVNRRTLYRRKDTPSVAERVPDNARMNF